MMTTRIRQKASSPRFILLSTAFLTIATICIGRYFDLDREDWPGWVQAIGSVWAILVAVWVSWQQAESQRKSEEQKERSELAGLLRSLRAELDSTILYTKMRVGHHFDAHQHGRPFLFKYPISENSFPIFDALIPKLGTIQDDELRNHIVQTYSKAKGIVLTFRAHNDLVADFLAADIKKTQDESVASIAHYDRCHATLVNYSHELKADFQSVCLEVDALMSKLRDM